MKNISFYKKSILKKEYKCYYEEFLKIIPESNI